MGYECGPGCLALMVLVRSWREAAPCPFLLISVFSLQRVLTYEVPRAHLDHLGHQVSLSGTLGRWGAMGHRGVKALPREGRSGSQGQGRLCKFSSASSSLSSPRPSIPGPLGPEGDQGESSVLGSTGACMCPSIPNWCQESLDEA